MIFRGARRITGKQTRRFYRALRFCAMAVAVICSMIDYMMDDALNWSSFAIAGRTCAWLVVSVAYKKRRNILKNEMLQLDCRSRFWEWDGICTRDGMDGRWISCSLLEPLQCLGPFP